MADEDLRAHIAWLDREATEQEAFVNALAPMPTPVMKGRSARSFATFAGSPSI